MTAKATQFWDGSVIIHTCYVLVASTGDVLWGVIGADNLPTLYASLAKARAERKERADPKEWKIVAVEVEVRSAALAKRAEVRV